MRVETTQVTKILIDAVDRLDAVTVILEDIKPRVGKIIIECFGKSWTYLWQGMGDKTLSQFFCSCDEHYLAGKLGRIESTVVDEDQIVRDAERLDDSSIDFSGDLRQNNALMRGLYSDDYNLPQMPNPEYQYLCRIINTIKDGLLVAPRELRNKN